jgi:hypothetical protein
MCYKPLRPDKGATMDYRWLDPHDSPISQDSKLRRTYLTEDPVMVSDGDQLDAVSAWIVPVIKDRYIADIGSVLVDHRWAKPRDSWASVRSELWAGITASFVRGMGQEDQLSLLSSLIRPAQSDQYRRALMYADVANDFLRDVGFLAEPVYEDIRKNQIIDFYRSEDRITFVVSEYLQCFSYLKGEFGANTFASKSSHLDGIRNHLEYLLNE